jgi:hypothetical protein
MTRLRPAASGAEKSWVRGAPGRAGPARQLYRDTAPPS